ncbi:MAG: hypothetical protein INQ03_03075 [Candidatus Heimdallarchaeota archaeon]|nr:hypothetical protein [Candidatus Heimdallarchaeota archaeon]
MDMDIQILLGTDESRMHLETIMATNADLNERLRPFLDNMDELRNSIGLDVIYWICLHDDYPIALISALNQRTSSNLLHTWTDIDDSDVFEKVINAMISRWLSQDKKEEYIADISHNSYLYEFLLGYSFKIDKTLLNVYEVKPEFTNVEIPGYLILKTPEGEDFGKIYDELIQRDLDLDSPIYVTKQQFIQFSKTLGDQLDNWLLVLDEQGNYKGFGASMSNPSNSTFPVLYGPHSDDERIQEYMLSEFLTHWKMKKAEQLRILRTSAINGPTLLKFGISSNSNQSIMRMSLKKRPRDDFYL